MDGFRLESLDLTDPANSIDDCLVYDNSNRALAVIMSRMFWRKELPQPFGVFYREDRETYDDMLQEQIRAVREKVGVGSLEHLLNSGDTWTIE